LLAIFKKKLFVILRGGLGNQLFIYAASKKIARALKISKIKYIFNIDILRDFTDIRYFIKSLNIKEYKKINKLNFLKVFLKYKIFCKNINDNIKNIQFYCWQKKFVLDGYFQNKKWYKSELFNIIDNIFSYNLIIKLKKIPKQDIVISFRRGDYVKLGFALNLNYYYLAIKKLQVKKYEKIKIITNDGFIPKEFLDYLKKNNFSVVKNKNYFQKKNKSLVDFLTLIKSKKLIMSNSSFCWWAAVCRSKLGLSSKNVIYPKFWTPLPNTHPGNPLGWLRVNNSFDKKN
jgi:hypothetical protein